MRKCHVCGLEVGEKVYICPDCGAEIVGSSGGLTLKAAPPEKKKATNSLGTSVSTGSGLTDILRAEDDTDSDFYGSLPTPMSYDLTDYESDKKAKNHYGKMIFRLCLVALLAFGLYMLITKVFLKKDGPESYKEALNTYIEAINEQDKDKMQFVSPPFLENRDVEAQSALDALAGVHIDSYEVEDTYFLNSDERSKLQDSIKYATTRTANLSEVVNIKLRITGEAGKLGKLVPTGATNGTIDVQIVCIRDSWYVLLVPYEDIKYN